MHYEGTEETTRDRVRRYLADNYANPAGAPLTADELDTVLDKHAVDIAHGADAGSYTYFVADDIATTAGLIVAESTTDYTNG